MSAANRGMLIADSAVTSKGVVKRFMLNISLSSARMGRIITPPKPNTNENKLYLRSTYQLRF